MIKFFRKIRQNLLMENRTAKYFKYAIGEIVLVVIGILIALQINTWNINRINANLEIEYLIGLKNDLENQVRDLEEVKNFSNNINNQAEAILAAYNLKNSLKDIDSFNTKISQIMYSRSFPDIRTTFNELNSTGQLKLIQNKKLRSQVIEFYQNSSEHYNSIQGNIKEVFYPHVFPVLKSSVIIQVKDFGYEATKFDEDEFEQKMRNQLKQDSFQPPTTFEIINAISTRIIIENSTRKYLESSLEEAKSLLLKLETELKNKLI